MGYGPVRRNSYLAHTFYLEEAHSCLEEAHSCLEEAHSCLGDECADLGNAYSGLADACSYLEASYEVASRVAEHMGKLAVEEAQAHSEVNAYPELLKGVERLL